MIYFLRQYSDHPLLLSLVQPWRCAGGQFLAPHSSWPATALAHLASEDGEGQSAGLAQLSGAPWAGGGVGGVPSTGGEAEGPRPCSEPRLLSPHRARAHHLVQQPTAWRPHGRCPRLRKHTETHTSLDISQLPSSITGHFLRCPRHHFFFFFTNNQFEYSFWILWFKLKSSEHVLISLLLYDSKLKEEMISHDFLAFYRANKWLIIKPSKIRSLQVLQFKKNCWFPLI